MGSTKSDTVGQSLFIVDRDWLRQGSKPRKSWTGNVRNRSLYGLAIEVNNCEPSQKLVRSRTRGRTKHRRLEQPEETTRLQDDLSSNANFTTSIPSSHGSSPGPSLDGDWSMIQDAPYVVATTDSCPSTSQEFIQQPVSRLSSIDSIKGLEFYLDCYLDIVGTAHHPLAARTSLHMTTSTAWSPLAFEEDLWLQNVALFSAFQHTKRRKGTAPATVDALMSSFLSQLNHRISKSDLSDGTIASVSCLMLGEHIKGNDELARVHASGMAEMIRLRGGLGTIQRTRRGKIVRADLVRSIDTLEPPMLPRLTRDSVPLGPDLISPPDQYREKINHLQKSGVSPELISTLWTLGSVCETIEAALIGYTILDATSFYESILCINHDLLSFNPRTPFDEILKISVLNFTQPMFRQCPFLEQSCRLRIQRLRSILEEHDMSNYDEEVVLWVTFVAYITAQEVPSERDWLKAMLCSSLKTMSLSQTASWDELKCQLQDFLWTDSIHNHIGFQSYETLGIEAQFSPPLSDVGISYVDISTL